MIRSWLRSRGIAEEYAALCAVQNVQREYYLGAAARLLVEARTGAYIRPESIDMMIENLARLREMYGVSPDIMQRSLIADEQSLAEEWPDDDKPEEDEGIYARV